MTGSAEAYIRVQVREWILFCAYFDASSIKSLMLFPCFPAMDASSYIIVTVLMPSFVGWSQNGTLRHTKQKYSIHATRTLTRNIYRQRDVSSKIQRQHQVKRSFLIQLEIFENEAVVTHL